jgi:hypothetical protein
MQAQRAYRIELKLLDGEQVLYAIGHHVVSLVAALIMPISFMVAALSLYVYIALGGGFTAERDIIAGTLALVDWLFLLLSLLLLLLWLLLGSVERGSYRATRWSLLLMLIVILLMVAYRATGGMLFAPNATAAQPFTPLGLSLLLISLVSAVSTMYQLFDLINDQLILTNMRIIYVNSAVLIPGLIEKRVQRDVILEDIQNVSARTQTYLEHWLNYSTIQLQTANVDVPLLFRAANNAHAMQQRIMRERQRLIEQQHERNFSRLVATRVYATKAEPPLWDYPHPVIVVPRWLRWLLKDNPQVDRQQRQVLWYPHWIFLIKVVVWPLVIMTVTIVILRLIANLAWIDPLPLWVGGGLFLFGCVGWTVYQVEDYRNDCYLLTSTTLVDIDRRPFGPELRRSASLGSIQTVTLQTTFLGSWLGYGDVVMTTAGTGGQFTFHRVPRPNEVAAAINQAMNAFRKLQRDQSLEQTLGLLHEFHEAQRRTGELR